MLTFLLKDSLGGNSKTVMIAGQFTDLLFLKNDLKLLALTLNDTCFVTILFVFFQLFLQPNVTTVKHSAHCGTHIEPKVLSIRQLLMR